MGLDVFTAAAAAAALFGAPGMPRRKPIPTRPCAWWSPSAPAARSTRSRASSAQSSATCGSSRWWSRTAPAPAAISARRRRRRRTPDGYTLHFGAQTLAVNVTIQPHKGFDPVRDLVPVIFVGTAQDVLMVPPQFPAKTVQELIDIARKRPGELNYASAGPGTSGHLATVLFSELTGVQFQHVPYNSLSQGVMDIMSGRISVWIVTLGGHLGNITSGKVRALAVSGESRAEQLPDVPTFKEIGVPFVAETSWYGIFAPKGTPQHDRRQGQSRREHSADAARREGARRHARLSLRRRPARAARRAAQERNREVGGDRGQSQPGEAVMPIPLVIAGLVPAIHVLLH